MLVAGMPHQQLGFAGKDVGTDHEHLYPYFHGKKAVGERPWYRTLVLNNSSITCRMGSVSGERQKLIVGIEKNRA